MMAITTLQSKQASCFHKAYDAIKYSIESGAQNPYASKQELLSLLLQLSEFEFGRSLIEHQSLTRYWRHYIVTYPLLEQNVSESNALSYEMLNHFPLVSAIQQRHRIVSELLQRTVVNHARLLSAPCGLMEELAYLDFKHIDNIELIGWDEAQKALEQAMGICQSRQLAQWVQLKCVDPWQFNVSGALDAISSHSLTLYEKDQKKVGQYYQDCFAALKEGGIFVSSFLTPPPDLDMECEWDFSKIDAKYLRKQKIIFTQLLNCKWGAYQKTIHVRQLLSQAGFKDIQFFYDDAKLFPVVLGVK